jgi:Fe-S cluster assembly ATP-binding protein
MFNRQLYSESKCIWLGYQSTDRHGKQSFLGTDCFDIVNLHSFDPSDRSYESHPTHPRPPPSIAATLDPVTVASLGKSIDERSRGGIFLAFQYPSEVPGVSNANFIRAALQARLPKGEDIDAVAYYKNLYSKMDLLEMDRKFTARAVNEGFSGGEKKRNEILQMMMLEPEYCILDETDSGLDIDALKIVAKGVNAMRSPDRGMLLITHYQRLLDYIKPDYVHVMAEGRIVRSGGPELALELEKDGYEFLKEPALA